MLKLESELKDQQLSQYHLLYGEEWYMVRYYKNCIVRCLAQPEDEMNLNLFHGDKVTPSEIADVGQILPFMAPQRLIVVQDSGFFSKSNDMAKYLESFPDTTYVVFVERKIDKRNQLYKWIGKHGCVTECARQSEKMLKTWMAGYLKRYQKGISSQTAEYLMERVGTDMETLSNELDKLIAYTADMDRIEMESVDAVCTGLTTSRIFDMIDAVASKQKQRALSLYGDLLANREAPMAILTLISRHINILIQIRELQALGMSRSEMAKKIGIPPFTVPKYTSQAERFKRSQLLSMLEKRADLEEDFKSGKMTDQMAVELFLLESLFDDS